MVPYIDRELGNYDMIGNMVLGVNVNIVTGC